MNTGRLEITTHMGCSINCRFCPQKLLLSQYYQQDKKRRAVLSLEDFKICVDKLPDGTRIDFSGMAEPWLNKECTDMVCYAARQGFPIAIYTTLVGMTLDDFERLKSLEFEEFVLHVPDDKNYSNIPISDGYLELLKNVVRFKKKDIPIVTGYSCHAGLHPVIREAIPKDSKLITEMIDRAGNLENDYVKSKENHGEVVCVNCGTDMNHNVLLPDGTILLCCMDYGLRHVLGNLLEESYEDILMSAEAGKVRNGLIDRGTDILCRNCTNAKTIHELFEEFYIFRDWCGNLRRNNDMQVEELARAEGKYNERVKELHEYKDWVGSLEKQITELKEELIRVEGQHDKRVEELHDYMDWVENLQKQGASLQNQISDLNEALSQSENISKGLTNERDCLQNELKRIREWKGYRMFARMNHEKEW